MSYALVLEGEKGTMTRTRSTLSNLELGNRPARLSTIRKLAEALDVEPKELMKE